MEVPWPVSSPRYDELDQLDSSIYASQSVNRDVVYQSEHAFCDQFPWLGCIHDSRDEVSSVWQKSGTEHGLGFDFDPLANQVSDNHGFHNFGELFKDDLSLCRPEISVTDCELRDLPNREFIGTVISRTLQTNISQFSTSLVPSIDPSTATAPLSPVPNQQYQSSLIHHLSSEDEELHWPNDSFNSVGQQRQEGNWFSSIDATLGALPEISSVSLSFGAPGPTQQPARSLAIIIPRFSPTLQDFSEVSATTVSDSNTRKRTSTSTLSPNTQIKDVQSASKRPASFDACVTVFETTPGAMKKVKRRRKLDPLSHKSFKVTRKIGACLECRFRKRPCNPGTPCEYCVKVYGSPKIAQITCHRESPFVGYGITDYFLLSSGKRIIDFNLKTKNFNKMKTQSHLTIDGRSGPCSLPLKLPISWQRLDSLPLEDQAEVWRTKQKKPTEKMTKHPPPGCIAIIPENDDELGQRLESWAMRYSAKFSCFHSKRYPTAYAYCVGMMYVSKKLPEYELVALLLRGGALSYVLRAGVKCPASEFHTIQARIDTILYRRLRAAESTLFAALQKLVWVSAGRLKREQLYPVAFVLWQQMRSTCLRSSHVDNLLSRSKGSKSQDFATNVDRLSYCFNLLLSTHTALFRSNSPIIMDLTDPANQDLLGGDEELIQEAMKLRKVILDFRKHSLSRPFKSSNWYKDATYGRFREVLNGRGV